MDEHTWFNSSISVTFIIILIIIYKNQKQKIRFLKVCITKDTKKMGFKTEMSA